MNNPCVQMQDKIADYVLGLLNQEDIAAFDKHISQCLQCREYTESLQSEKRSLLQFGKTLDSEMDARQARIIEALNQRSSEQNRLLSIRRTIMQSKMTKPAAAAAIILAVGLSINFLDKSVTPAYAIEQTIEACHSVRYLHIKSYEPGHDEPKEFWVEFDEYGEVKHVRMDFPEWAGGGDGPKIVVWKENKADIWYKQEKSLIRMPDKTVADSMLETVKMFDPKGMLERFQGEKLDGLVKIEIDQPSNKLKPIIITATSLPGTTVMPGKRGVLFIDQSTKLVTHMDLYLLQDDEYEYASTIEFYDYNQQIDPNMFNLDEAPSDLTRIDYTTQEIGLIQGNLTDKEIAVKVVREFYEALIIEDYAKAGQIYGGVPAAKMQERWQNVNVLRIISISEPIPHPYPRVGGFQVHCEIEIEKDGIKSILKPYGPGVRPVHGQSHRWNIHGGVK